MNYKIFSLFLLVSGALCEFRYHPRKTREEVEEQRSGLDPFGITLDDFSEIWHGRGQEYLDERLRYQPNHGKAKNVIMFLGDGLSMITTAATRAYLGGEEVELSYDKFPHIGYVKTYCVDRQVPDSACTANAFLHGVKNNINVLGLTANVSRSTCHFNDDDMTFSIAKWAQDAGKATGIVTTTRVTHATPAGAYAHSPARGWENNAAISSACRNDPTSRVVDIAHQLVHGEEGRNFRVVLGCGRREFLNTTVRDEENGAGRRSDGRNLIEEWLTDRNQAGNAEYIWNKRQLDQVNIDSIDYLLGLFENDHCMYRNDIIDRNLRHQEPLLTDMTRKAIQMLQKDENGFFLLVESGRIDHAHHANRAPQSLDETAEFARAVSMAKALTRDDDTLIVVTSDHSHVFTYAGYPARRNDINAIAGRGSDRLPYETLSYANGPSAAGTFGSDGNRRDITNDNFGASRRTHQSLVPLSSETHAGEDVAVYANGPWAQLFEGSYEQSGIPLAMAYAAHIGPYADRTPINPSSRA